MATSQYPEGFEPIVDQKPSYPEGFEPITEQQPVEQQDGVDIGSKITGLAPASPRAVEALNQAQYEADYPDISRASKFIRQDLPYMGGMVASAMIPEATPIRMAAAGVLGYAGSKLGLTEASNILGDPQAAKDVSNPHAGIAALNEGIMNESLGPGMAMAWGALKGGSRWVGARGKQLYEAAQNMGVHLTPSQLKDNPATLLETLGNATYFGRKILSDNRIKNIKALVDQRQKMIDAEVPTENLTKVGEDIQAKMKPFFQEEEAALKEHSDYIETLKQEVKTFNDQAAINQKTKEIAENERLLKEHQDAIETSKNNFLTKLGSTESHLQLGATAKKAFREKEKAYKEATNRLYEKAKSYLPSGEKITVTSPQIVAKQILREERELLTPEKSSIYSKIQAIADGSNAEFVPENTSAALKRIVPSTDNGVGLINSFREKIAMGDIRGASNVLDVIPKLGSISGISSQDVSLLRKSLEQDKLSRKLSYDAVIKEKNDLWDLISSRTSIGAEREGAKFVSNREGALLKRLAQAYDEALNKSFERSSPEAKKAYNTAKNFYSALKNRQDTYAFKKFVTSNQDELMPVFFPTKASGTQGATIDALNARKLVDKDTYGKLKTRFETDLINTPVDKLATRLDSYGDEMLSHTIGNDKLLQLRDVVRIFENKPSKYVADPFTPYVYTPPDLKVEFETNPLLKKVLSAETRQNPQNVLDIIVHPGAVNNIKTVRPMIGEEGMSQLRSAWLKNASQMDTVQFAKHVDEYGPEVLKELFGTTGANTLKQISEVSKAMPKGGTISLKTPPLASLAGASLGTGSGASMFIHNPVLAVATMVGIPALVEINSAMMAKLVKSPTYSKWLVGAFKAGNSEKQNIEIFTRLAQAVERETRKEENQ